MLIGLPKEIKDHEYRVGLKPIDVETLTQAGHSVFVQSGAGLGVNFTDDTYAKAGATLVDSASAVYSQAQMIIKVKEPLAEEYTLLQKGQILFTYFHFASNEKLSKAMIEKKVIAIAYETIELPDGTLPCLLPMSQIAGRLSVQEGAKYLEKPFGGRGVLLGGVPGILPGKVAILGGGVVGFNAGQMAVGLGADVTLLDVNSRRLEYINSVLPSIKTLYSNAQNIRHVLQESDLVIGSVLLPGAKTPKLVKKTDLAFMKPHSVIVDVAVDQGGCFESTLPTTHTNPIFVEQDIVHYCVANMPGAVPLSSTEALTSNTFPYALQIANKGWKQACENNLALLKGVSFVEGLCTSLPVAQTLGLDFIPAESTF